MFTGHHFIRVLPTCVVVLLTANICIVDCREMSAYYGPVPKPDPGQPHGRYYWLKSAMQNLQSGCPSKRDTSGKGTLSGSIETETTHSFENAGTEVTFLVESTPYVYNPLGMENRGIPDDSITSSSYHSTWVSRYPPQYARLNVYQYPWCADGNDDAPWIQVDFNDNVHITGLTTKGYIYKSVHYYVKTYTVAYNEGQSWSDVTSQDGTPQQFTGNIDGINAVTVRFDEALHARYIRILPTSWNEMYTNENCCLHFEVLGYR